MGIFSKKEKSLIPEVERPGMPRQNSARGNSSKPGEPDTEVRDRRYGGRTAPSYNPGQTPGSYGGYGNYGNQPATHQQGSAGYGNYSQQQQQPQGQQGAGYGAYGNNSGMGSNANTALANARAPNRKTEAGFDDYAGVKRPAQPRTQGSYGAEYGDNADPYAGGGSRNAGGAAYGDNAAEGGDDSKDGQEQTNEEDDEVEAIKQQIRFTKQESLATTRNAIRTAQEAEMTASNTLARLGEQTDRIANTELALDKAKGYNSRAADGAKEIARLNQSIFRPTVQFNKDAKRAAEEQRLLARHIEEKNEREDARKAAYESRMRVEQGFQEAERSSRFGKFGKAAQSSKEPAPTGRAKWEQGGRYQFEASNSDDELEQELDSNLDEIAAISGRLKILASTAGREIDAQNKHLDRIGGKVDNLDDKITMNTSYLKRIK